MAIHVELRDEAGSTVTDVPDPSGGSFTAASDFERFVDRPPYGQVPTGTPVVESLDPSGTTVTPSGAMARVISDCVRALEVARSGPERRGLLRLRSLAEECSRRPGSALRWTLD